MTKRRIRYILFALFVIALTGGWLLLRAATAPVKVGPPVYLRLDHKTPLQEVLTKLEREGVIRSASATLLLGRFMRAPSPVRTGTYQLQPGWAASAIFKALRNPLKQMVRIPETNWARRTANILQQKNVTHAEDYLALVNDPGQFKNAVPFPLSDKSLEGYLYPDTYDLPPLLGAKGVVERQLQNFDHRVWDGLNKPKNLYRALIIGSMVELEVAKDSERPIVAGVIENRLKKGMPLQIDAALLYGLGKWRTLTYKDYREIDSPYNLYTHKGLPPTPICSPTVKSIEAALHPANHDYLYYVAMPEGYHLFSSTYKDHLANIRKRNAAKDKVKKE